MVLIKLQNNFIEVKLCQGCSPVNLVHISRIAFHKNTSLGLYALGLKLAQPCYRERLREKWMCLRANPPVIRLFDHEI